MPKQKNTTYSQRCLSDTMKKTHSFSEAGFEADFVQLKTLADGDTRGGGGLPWAKRLVTSIVKIMKDSPLKKRRFKRN